MVIHVYLELLVFQQINVVTHLETAPVEAYLLPADLQVIVLNHVTQYQTILHVQEMTLHFQVILLQVYNAVVLHQSALPAVPPPVLLPVMLVMIVLILAPCLELVAQNIADVRFVILIALRVLLQAAALPVVPLVLAALITVQIAVMLIMALVLLMKQTIVSVNGITFLIASTIAALHVRELPVVLPQVLAAI